MDLSVAWQGKEVWTVQQVYQSHGWWGEGNPHSGPRALEEMYRPYVHMNDLPHTDHTFTLCHNYCLTKIGSLCWVFCQLEKSSYMQCVCLCSQLYQKSTRESAKPSKTSPRSSPAVDTKVQRRQRIRYQTMTGAVTHCLKVVFYHMGVCAEVRGSTDTVNKHTPLFCRRRVNPNWCNDGSRQDLWGDSSAGGRAGRYWRNCARWSM